MMMGAMLAVAGAAAPDAHALTLSGTVSDVVDGDTVKVVVRGFETPVRLLGIDTPETRDPRKPVQCFGPQASARTARLLPVGRRVRLVTDPTQDERDRYARLLAYVYTPGKSGPRGSVNFALVATGHAKVYVQEGERFTHAVPFFRAQHRARKVRNGLWGPPCRGNTTKPDPTARESAPAPRRRAPAPVPARAGCDPNYAGECIPPAPPDIDCGEIAARNFRVVGEDVHNLDVDRDGIACEE
jgi:micrococcal nuclease